MTRMGFLLLIVPLALTGCLQLPGQGAKHQGVQKGTPPQVDPNLAPPTKPGQVAAPTPKQAQSGQGMMTHTTVQRPPLNPDDIHSGNAYQALEQAAEGINQDRIFCPSHGTAGCPHCEENWPR